MNTAKKSISNATPRRIPNVGEILVHDNKNQANRPGKVVVVDHVKGYVTVYRPEGRVPRTDIQFASLRHYLVATPADFPGVDFDEESGKARSTLSDAPFVQRHTVAHEPPAVNDTPPSEPPPPALAVNDTAAAPPVATSVPASNDTIALVMALMREQREENRAFMERILERLAPQNAPTPVPAPVVVESPKKGKDADKDAVNKEIIGRETSWAEPLIKRFIAAELEVVAFDSEVNISRAMLPGEFHDALVVWCQQNGEPTPDPRTTFFLLDDRISPTRHGVKDGQGKKRKTMFARRRQMNLDLSGDSEFVEVMSRARSLWPAFKEDSTVALRIKTMLSGRGRRNSVTKEEMFEAIRGAALESKRKNVSTYPEMVFGNPNTVRVYAKLAADFGGAK